VLLPATALRYLYCNGTIGGMPVSKSLRTIKKSAAQPSVSRAKLRLAVKNTSSAAAPGRTASTSKSGAAKKKSARKSSTAKVSNRDASVRPQTEGVNTYVHQPSIIRPVANLA